MLFYTFLLNLKLCKNKNIKDVIMNFCYFSNLLLAYLRKNNSFDGNLLKVDDIINKIFSNDKNEKKLMFIFKKVK